MAAASQTCTVPAELVAAFKKFKTSKNSANSAYIMKIDKASLAVVLDQQLDNTPFGQLADVLPESQPRFIAYSYKHTHKDGRSSFPLVFIYYCPPSNAQSSMMYASTKTQVVQALGISKDFEVRDASELNEEWLQQKLGLFGA
jgi:hypothetical protein